MATTIHPDLYEVAGAVEILSPTRYAVLGEIRDAALGGPGQWAAGPSLLPSLESELYTRLYTRSSAQVATSLDARARADHVVALSGANSGRGSWEPGWVLASIEGDGRLTVVKGGIVYWVPRDGVRTGRRTARPGEFCWVWVPKELRCLDPDYYYAIGDADLSDERGGPVPMVRFYWHLTARAAIPYIAAVTEILNARKIPFRTKVLSDPGVYFRADAGVLYLQRHDYRRLGDAIQAIHGRIKFDLKLQVPLFTKHLAPGLGLAEDPRNGMSFGQHRCQLAAQGLWRSFLQGDRTRESRTATLAAAFREAGLKPTSPHLSPGSRDYYSLQPKGGRSSRVPGAAGSAHTSRARRKRQKP
jgi:HopA1 effector protein family